MKPAAYTITLLTPLLLLLQFCAAAQGVVFTATAGSQKISMEDQVEVTITIHNAAGIREMGIDPRKDFVIVAGPFLANNSVQTSYGGRVTESASTSLTYVLQPKHTGNLVIPAAIAIDAKGNTYHSNTISISVCRAKAVQTRGGGMGAMRMQAVPQPQKTDLSNEVFIRAYVAKNTVHVGEQVTLAWKLYTRVPLRMSMFNPPDITGVFIQPFDSMVQDPEQQETVNGRPYHVYVLKKQALFPQQAGKLDIEPALLEGSVRVKVQSGQDDILNGMFDDPFFRQAMRGMGDPFGYQDVPLALKSEPLVLNVLPLPTAGQPEGFTGAVGKFVAKSSIDKQSISTDNVATYTLQLEGTGNFKLFTAPHLVLPDGLSTFEPKISDSITGSTGSVSGVKKITYSIASRSTGDFVIPAQSFSYFNPETNQYEIKHTPSYTIHVAQGRQDELSNSQASLTDIHDIVSTPVAVVTNITPLILKAGYWSSYSMPVLLLIGMMAYKRRKDEADIESTPGLRQQRANTIAAKQLAQAHTFLKAGQSKAYYEAISKAIWDYLSNKLNIPYAQLSRDRAFSALTAIGISQQLQDELIAVLDQCEHALYAPGNNAQLMDEVYHTTSSLLTRIEAAAAK